MSSDSRPDLSVLVAGVPSRIVSAAGGLLTDLLVQSNGRNVEVLYLYDQKGWPVGRKRNELLRMASGQYLAFVDDDDEIAPDYLSSILRCISENPGVDVICFQQVCRLMETGKTRHCTYSVDYEYEGGPLMDGSMKSNGDEWWRGKPAHTMVWRSEIAKQGKFPEKNFGEDVEFVAQVCPLVQTEVHIHRPLYTYKFDSRTSETRG